MDGAGRVKPAKSSASPASAISISTRRRPPELLTRLATLADRPGGLSYQITAILLDVRLMALLLAAGAFAADEQPREVTPGDGPGAPPSDAIVLFDGRNSLEWTHADGRPAEWPVIDGALVCKTGSGDILTKRQIGDVQLHIEFAIPDMPQARDQAKGNSGVYLQGRYEIQVLDSYRNPTYPNGSAGALYGQYAPLVNASRPPEEWQSYDVVFHMPKCAGGKPVDPGTLTLFHNGVLVQDHVSIQGPTNGSDNALACERG